MDGIKILLGLYLITGIYSGLAFGETNKGEQMNIITLDNTREEKILTALNPLLEHTDSAVNSKAADVLVALGTDKALDRLVNYAVHHLDDPTGKSKRPGPGWERLRSLGTVILPAVSRVYSKELPFNTRLALIHILQQIGDKAGSALLKVIIKNDEPRIVQAAAEALGRVAGESAFDTLVSLLKSDNEYHKLGAIYGLQRLNNPQAVEPLLHMLMAEDGHPVQFSAGSGDSPNSLHQAAATAIDILTGEYFDGKIEEIKKWITKNR